MTICEPNSLSVLFWLLTSCAVPAIGYFVLRKIVKNKWICIVMSIAIFLFLFFLTPFIAGKFLVCSGPLVGYDGRIMA